MTLTEFTLKWSNTWRFDYWWRKKYKVSFNSEAHRSMTQIDIKMEYIEEFMANKQLEQLERNEADRKEYAESGKWIKTRVDENKENDAFDKMDLSQF